MNANQKSDSNQLAIFFTLLKYAFELLFPSLLMLKIYRMVSKATWVQSDEGWIKAQQEKCLKVAGIMLLPSILSVLLAQGTFEELKLSHKLSGVYDLGIKKKQFKKGQAELSRVLEALPYKQIATDLLIIFIIPAGLSLYIRTNNELLLKTRKLEKVLRENSFWREGKTGLAIYTPVGIIMDITGHNAKEVVHNTSIWVALNIEVDQTDWEENPRDRSIVMFKNRFILESAYIYKNDKN